MVAAPPLATLLRYDAITAALRRLAARAGGRFGERLAAYALAAPDLVVFAARALGDGRVSRTVRGEIVAAALYIASPIDLVPEALFGPLGLVDDALVVSRLFDTLLNRIDPAVVRELWPGDRAVLEALQRLAREARRVFGLGFREGVRLLARRALREAGSSRERLWRLLLAARRSAL